MDPIWRHKAQNWGSRCQKTTLQSALWQKTPLHTISVMAKTSGNRFRDWGWYSVQQEGDISDSISLESVTCTASTAWPIQTNRLPKVAGLVSCRAPWSLNLKMFPQRGVAFKLFSVIKSKYGWRDRCGGPISKSRCKLPYYNEYFNMANGWGIFFLTLPNLTLLTDYYKFNTSRYMWELTDWLN